MHQTSGSIVILKETTENPITLMGTRAGYCQNSDTTDPIKNYKRGIQCLTSNHGRVLEYVNVEMVLRDWSIVTLREWYTHIGGAPTRLQNSTRSIDHSEFNYLTPNTISDDFIANNVYKDIMEKIHNAYKSLIYNNIPFEDAAFVLPLGTASTVVDKRNLRNLIDMSHQRLCRKASPAYITLFQMICSALHDYSTEWAYIVDNYFVPKCIAYHGCNEKNPCGFYKQYTHQTKECESTDEQ